MRWIKWAGIILGALLLAGSMAMLRAKWRTPDNKVADYFEKKALAFEIQRIPFLSDSLRLITTGRPLSDEATPLLLFVHGAPGSSDNFHAYLSDSILCRRASLLAFDRPGYGYSDYGRAQRSLKVQAAAIGAILDLYPQKKVVLIGHSYGGPIAVRAALDYPTRIKGLLLLAPVQDPDAEPIFWFSWFAHWKMTRWMLSGSWQVSGDEKFSHRKELEYLLSDWPALSVPVSHIHGGKDWMAPPANITFSRTHIAPERLHLLVLPEEGHLIPFVRFHETRKELLRLLESLGYTFP